MTTINWRLRRAVETLEAGGIIAYPTEAVYGVGCDPWDEDALLDLLEIKQRPWEKGLILIASDFNQLQDFIQPVPADILKQLQQSWPGPVTWLLPVRDEVSELLTGVHDTIAVRVTAHQQTRDLCEAFGGAIVSTSANVAGVRPAKNVHQVRWQLPGLDYVMPGSLGGATRPSQIRDARTGAILR
ncbi:Sua5/YciO/YrdC/YwlC family protein [Methylophaga sp.]|uniref:L-threonylcarbamoyladenylate synthase n=1 Tax=Methylophaga sp. TaxID=2024840 RepID=UPI0013FFA75D|nr:Sua5/YciO/YrdC/YwlC family protein [Methylophaga sp.]MTI63539.1 tRNA threonylcarbamoyladenosine biosynthesis protein RimN [Methylophaga sp.]